MINEDYVSFETAKLLKEKGFDWECKTMKFYPEPDYDQESPDGVSAPTLQTAMKWLMEIHQIFIHIQRCKKFKFFFTIENMNISSENYEYSLGHFKEFERNTYEEACEAAIKYCLENLI